MAETLLLWAQLSERKGFREFGNDFFSRWPPFPLQTLPDAHSGFSVSESLSGLLLDVRIHSFTRDMPSFILNIDTKMRKGFSGNPVVKNPPVIAGDTGDMGPILR